MLVARAVLFGGGTMASDQPAPVADFSGVAAGFGTIGAAW
jgi:hypothetical protein